MSKSKFALKRSECLFSLWAGRFEALFVKCGILCPLFLFLSFWGMWTEDSSSMFFFKGGIVLFLLSGAGLVLAMKYRNKEESIRTFLSETIED
jgi:hypothetical protein